MQIVVSTLAFIYGNQLRCSAVRTFGPLIVTFYSASWELASIKDITVVSQEANRERVRLTYTNGESAETVVSRVTRMSIELIVGKHGHVSAGNSTATTGTFNGIKQQNYQALLVVTPLIWLANTLLFKLIAQSPVASGLMLLANIVWALASVRYGIAVCKHFRTMRYVGWRFYQQRVKHRPAGR